jgi:hypothetical protein
VGRGDCRASGLGGIAITGFAENDTMTGFVAVSDTFASNTLVGTGASMPVDPITLPVVIQRTIDGLSAAVTNLMPASGVAKSALATKMCVARRGLGTARAWLEN